MHLEWGGVYPTLFAWCVLSDTIVVELSLSLYIVIDGT